MKLSLAVALLGDLNLALKAALLPTVRDVIARPKLLLMPKILSQTFMAHVWTVFGAGTDEAARAVKENLITLHARGVVLDIGAAGHGHTVTYLQRRKVHKYVALEPNVLMHQRIRENANLAGYTEGNGSLIILPYGADNAPAIIQTLSSVDGPPFDTLVSVLTMCSIRDSQRVLTRLVAEVLKPGGQLLFYEHVLSPRADVAWWQRFWSPLWKVWFDGCRLDCPTHLWIDGMMTPDVHGTLKSMWSERKVWGKEGEPDENLFWHRVGQYIKNVE
ncbi:hypothetical protein BDP27DRAFT_1227855 [Rhodocollybia butyracea]|uniref:S-adenosyl-L-methionine-dependent methyltransferase n=1 Tax=Rhodocollybia butyracea TaxID=206335 RepID=A0A9P5PMZ8_9AGAR|nr:hypothetical protein BDP27DRAFT_1227855 [Rhodocollybia butyracea]